MKWILASERLPNKQGQYCIKEMIHGSLCLSVDYWGQVGGYTEFYNRTGGSEFEWLDETASDEKDKEIEQLKTSLEMTQLGLVRCSDDKQEARNEAKALSAIKKGLETSLTDSFKEIERLKGLIRDQFWLRRQGTGNSDRVIQQAWLQFKTDNSI